MVRGLSLRWDSMQQALWPLCDAQLAGLTYLQDIPRHRMDEAVQADFEMERCQNHRAYAVE